MSQLRVRFAPSPTGYLHIGGARTALFNYLLARQQGGKMILRIEDTDVERSTQESVDAILQAMDWLGLDYDEGPFYQSERFDHYQAKVQQLLDEGKAYRCYCTTDELTVKRELAMKLGQKPKYDGTCRERADQPAGQPCVIRFKAPPEGDTGFFDQIKGPIVFDNEELDDLIIQRTDGTPTYNFVVVIDDAEMGITLVIRGDDHINNTPRQIQLYQALGYPVPEFAHVPMILGADKARLSKRHGATSVMAYKDEGYLPEALLNYLVRLGWSHGDDEIFSKAELIKLFSLKSVGKSAGVFNPEKLLWLNSHYIKTGDPLRLGAILCEHLTAMGIDTSFGPDPAAVVKTLKERAKTMVEMAASAAFYYRPELEYDSEAVAKFLTAEQQPVLDLLLHKLEACSDWTHDGIEAVFKGVMADCGLKLGKIGPSVRVALAGGTTSPGIYEVLEVLGKDESLRRLRVGINKIV
ncbi:MAG: glutamate--tRNA ligase [Desulfuromonadaceae bacterium]|nr:glutamate--tRNA ligase [Desulfuromonadaceae bacterium]